MRRILLLITDLKIGGTPSVVRELASRLHAPPSVVVDVACLAPSGPVAEQLQSRGINVAALGAASASSVSVIPKLLHLIRNGAGGGGAYDTVFSFLVHANAAAAACAPFTPSVRYLQSIQTTQPRPRWHWPIQAAARFAAEKIVVPSQSVADVAIHRARVPTPKVVVIPNAIDTGDFALRTRSISTPARVGFIGRLDPVKRIPDLVEAVGQLAGRATLDIFGEGSEAASLERMISQKNLGALVRLRGLVGGPQEALEQIEILVLPSEAEGFGLVLIEAMASGVPVVGTNVAGIRDVIRDGSTGLLAAPASPDALGANILRLIEAPSLREKLVAAALEDVSIRFSWEAVLPLYRELLGL